MYSTRKTDDKKKLTLTLKLGHEIKQFINHEYDDYAGQTVNQYGCSNSLTYVDLHFR